MLYIFCPVLRYLPITVGVGAAVQIMVSLVILDLVFHLLVLQELKEVIHLAVKQVLVVLDVADLD
ncbi:MAG: hypothetical protein KME05_20755 [Gloeocapsa sp. UFS-A4-WI-NPMV-4B04]|jgi:hypothetical protein|nr:hypothetical protein [Gloeocapsa sp. UFS-A4-WI-NPMV-4B04]